MPSALAALAAMLVIAPDAAAAPVTVTWSGLGVQPRWSEKANWDGGQAPGESGEPVDLVFPLSACQPDPLGCPETTNDLAGLSVGTLTLESRVLAIEPPEPPQGPAPAGYLVKGGQPLTLTEGVVAHTTEEGSGQGLEEANRTTLALPLVLGAANSWSVGPAPGGLDVSGSITGEHPLAVTLAEGDPLELAGVTDVGPITITGQSGVTFGGPEANGDLNGTDGEPVDLKGGSLLGGGHVGPLTLEGAEAEPGFPGSGGKLEVNGDLSLDSASGLTVEDNPAHRTPEEVTVAGHAQLGSARLTLLEACVEPGSTFTLVRAQGGVSGQFTDPEGAPIENGQVLEDLTPSGCGEEKQEPAPALRIEYGAETVTATAVAGEEPEATGEEPPLGSLYYGAAEQGIAAYTSSSPVLSVDGPPRVRSRKVLIALHCTSSEGACTSVGLRLSVVEHRRNGHLTGLSAARRDRRSSRVVVLAAAHVTVAAGQSRTVEMPLKPAAAGIAAHRTVRALLGVTYGGRTVSRETVVIPAAARRLR